LCIIFTNQIKEEKFANQYQKLILHCFFPNELSAIRIDVLVPAYSYFPIGFDPIPVEQKWKIVTSGLSEMAEGDESTLAEAGLEEKVLALRKEY
jgi:hypothetical protein